MRVTERKVKGFCSFCGAYRAFTVGVVRHNHEEIYVSHVLMPTYVYQGSTYIGRCSAGHEHDVVFRPVPSGLELNRAEVPKRASDISKHKFGRGVAGLALHIAEQAAFKRPWQEAHYKRGHECSTNCPEYDWDDYGGGY